MKKLKIFVYSFVFLFLFSFSFAQVEDVVDEITEEVTESVELESEDALDLDEESENVEDSDLSDLQWVSIVSQQVDEESDIELYEEDMDDVEDLWNWELHRADIWEMLDNLSIGFCNNWLDNVTSSLSAALTGWVPYKVCIVIMNNFSRDITINLDFVDVWTDQYWHLSCDAEHWFEQYVVNSDKINNFVVPAWNYIIKEAEVLYPISIKENQAWCFAIWIDWEQNIRDTDQWWIQFSAISRKSILANFFVWSLDKLKNELDIKNVRTSMNEDGELILKFDVQNIWNMENELEIKWYIKNIFWFKKDFLSTRDTWIWDNIVAWHTSTLEVNMWIIPNYWWLFNIEFELTGTPVFSYEVSDDFDKSLLEPLTYTEKTTYFEMPWLIAIIVVIIIILLIVLFRKPKPQVVYVQAPQQPQQPQPQYQQPQYQNPQYQQPVNNQVPQQPQYQQPQQPMQQ